jgi:ribonucleoside-diphosphate reductase alpha chain
MGATALANGTDPVSTLNMLVPEARITGFSESVSTFAISTASASATDARSKAKLQGYTGDSCGECGNYTMVRNGSCLKCNSCGATTGCS